MQRLSVNVFDEHPAYFPTNQDIVYLIGNNGTGKSELLRTLKKHFEINKEEVLYFSDDRLFNLTSSQLAIFLMKHKEHKDSYLTKYGIDFELAMKSCKKGEYISGGIGQIVNFFGQIENKNDVIVLIDEPEKHLDLEKQSTLVRNIKNLPNVKKVIVATHSPTIIENDWDYCMYIERCVQLYGNLIYINRKHFPHLLKLINEHWEEYIEYEIESKANRLSLLFSLTKTTKQFLNDLQIGSVFISSTKDTSILELTFNYNDNVISMKSGNFEDLNNIFPGSNDEREIVVELFKSFPIEEIINQKKIEG